jgi:hypothetical protein
VIAGEEKVLRVHYILRMHFWVNADCVDVQRG